MVIEKPSYIVAELPDDLALWVREVRQRFEPAIAHMPEEITLTGSSGVGTLLEGQALKDVGKNIQKAIAGKTHFSFKLLGIAKFKGTDIFFAEPERAGFDALHNALKSSSLRFKKTPFPYKPHCSLKGYTALEAGQREALEALKVPEGSYQLKSISVYELEQMKPRKLLSFML